MTLTLELSPDVERALEEKAHSAGMDLPTYATGVLEQKARRSAARPKLLGKYARLPGSVDDFLREKHAERDREAAGQETSTQEAAGTTRV